MRVSAARKPVRWVPPSLVLMLLTYERERLAVGIVVLHSDVYDDAVALFAERDGFAVQWRLVLVEALDERGYASLVVELFRALFFLPFVEQLYLQAAIEEGQLAQPGRQRVEVERRSP